MITEFKTTLCGWRISPTAFHCLCYHPQAPHATPITAGQHRDILPLRNYHQNYDDGDSIGFLSSVSRLLSFLRCVL